MSKSYCGMSLNSIASLNFYKPIYRGLKLKFIICWQGSDIKHLLYNFKLFKPLSKNV